MKQRIVPIVVILVVLLGLLTWLSAALPYIASSKQQSAFASESAALEPALNDLMQTSPEVRRMCDTYDQGYWRSEARCSTDAVYDYRTESEAQPGGRAAIIKHAAALEAILKARGWSNDRPQDPNQTIEATLPTEDGFPYRTNSLPMHKNIGNVSCNLRIDASGSVKAPAVNVNGFGCSQHVTYYFPHLVRRHHVLI